MIEFGDMIGYIIFCAIGGSFAILNRYRPKQESQDRKDKFSTGWEEQS